MKKTLLWIIMILLLSVTGCGLIKPSGPTELTDDDEIKVTLNQKGGRLTLENVGVLEFDADALKDDCDIFFAVGRNRNFELAETLGFVLGQSLVEIDLSPTRALNEDFSLTLENDWETAQVIYISYDGDYDVLEGRIRRSGITVRATEPGYYGVVDVSGTDWSSNGHTDFEQETPTPDSQEPDTPETDSEPEPEPEPEPIVPDTILYQGLLIGVNKNKMDIIDPNSNTKETYLEVDEAYKIFPRPLNTAYPLLLGKSVEFPHQLALVNPLFNEIELIDVLEYGDIQEGIWSPDGEMAALLVSNYTTERPELYIYKTQERTAHFIDHSEDGWFMNLSWSLDSEHLIYSHGVYDTSLMQYHNILKIKTMGSPIETILSYPSAYAYLHSDTGDLSATLNQFYGYGVGPESTTSAVETFFRLDIPSFSLVYFEDYSDYFSDYMASVGLGQTGYDLYYKSDRFGMPKFFISNLTDALTVYDWGSNSILPGGQLDAAKWISQAYSEMRFVPWAPH